MKHIEENKQNRNPLILYYKSYYDKEWQQKRKTEAEINKKAKGTITTFGTVADRSDTPRDIKRDRDKGIPIIRQNHKNYEYKPT